MNSYAPYPYAGDDPWYFGHVSVPVTLTPVYPKTTKVNRLVYSNTSDTDQTLTIYDISTNNNGQPCQIWPTVQMPAHSADFVKIQAMANGGVQWVASAANVIHAQLIGGCPDE